MLNNIVLISWCRRQSGGGNNDPIAQLYKNSVDMNINNVHKRRNEIKYWPSSFSSPTQLTVWSLNP